MSSTTTLPVALLRLSTADVPGLGENEVLVLMALVAHADRAGVCWPSVDTIAQVARRSVRCARATLGRLEALGLVKIDRRRADGRQGTSVYTVSLDRMLALANEHPRLRAANLKDGSPSVHEVQSGGESSVHAVHSGEGAQSAPDDNPECTSRHFQSAPGAAELSQGTDPRTEGARSASTPPVADETETTERAEAEPSSAPLPAPRAEKPARKTGSPKPKPERTPKVDPGVIEILTAWRASYETATGTKPHEARGKDYGIAKKILAAHDGDAKAAVFTVQTAVAGCPKRTRGERDLGHILGAINVWRPLTIDIRHVVAPARRPMPGPYDHLADVTARKALSIASGHERAKEYDAALATLATLSTSDKAVADQVRIIRARIPGTSEQAEAAENGLRLRAQLDAMFDDKPKKAGGTT